MKTNFLNLVAYDLIATQSGAKMPQNTGGGNSQTKRATLALPLRYLCAMLLVLFMGVGNMWGAAGDATTSNAPKSGGTSKDYANTISVAAGYLDGNVMYYISNNLTFISTDGLEANYLGFVFKPSVDLTIDFEGFNGNSGDVNITYQIDSIADAAFYEVFTVAGSNKISEKIISDNGGENASSTHTVLNYWKDNGVVKYSSKKWQSNGDNAPKNLAGQQNTTYFGNTRLVTDKVVAISSTKSAAAGTYSFMRDATNKFVFKAGKVYRIYSTRGSSKTGYKSFTFTPVYQLTWDFDGGSTSAVAGDDYTAAGYYVKGASLTYPENSTMSKTNYIFTDWSSSATAMPASALTITAQWALAGSAYDVNIASMTNGSVVASPASQVEDGTVTLTVTPDDGYLLSSLSVVGDVSGDEVTVTANQFTMPAEDVTVNATFSLAPTYIVTLNPAGGTIVDATGWTLNAGNYEKEVSDGTELTLPTFTKANRTFKTWRNAVPADVTSPITVTADVTLTAVWNATVENVIYSWESPSGTVIETGGTAVTYKGDDPVDGDPEVNVLNNGNYVLQVSGDNTASSSKNHIRITLTSGNAVKSGDKVKLIAYANNPSNNTRPRLIDGSGNQLCVAGSNMPAYTDPYIGTLTVADGINTELIKLTRASGYTGTNTMVKKLQIVRETLVEEANLRTVTFNYNDGGATSSTTVEVASGATVAAPANPTWAHHRFHEWQLGGVAYDFSTAVTSNIILTADWTQLYTVTYAKGEESATGDAPTQDELAAGEKFTVAANPFAYEGHDFSTWNDGSKDVAPASEYTMGSANVTLTAQWITATTKATVTYKDGTTTLGSEEVTISTGHPAEYATYQTKNLATFDGWYNDPDLAEGHKIADISALTASANVNVYGKWNYQYATSVNIEQWTLDNGKGVSDAQKEAQTGALMSLMGNRNYSSGIAYDKGNIELDSLNDDPSKTNRNYAYLGLKVKKSGEMLDFRLAKDSYVKVKFGNVAATPKVSINGADYADMELTAGVYSYTATGNDYVSIKTASDGAVVFQQVMINEPIAEVTLPWRVTYDANGGTFAKDGKSDIYTGTALVIGDATPADDEHLFDGWYDGDTKINAASYVPTANVTLVAKYVLKPSPFSLTTLTYTIGAGEAQNVGYVEGTYTYTVELPYAGSYENITVAATLKEGASSIVEDETKVLTVTSLPGVATFTVSDGAEGTQLYTINFKKAAKDGVEIIGVVTTGGTNKTVSGLYKGDASVSLANDKKIGNGNYIYVTLAEGYTFEETDVLVVDVKAKSDMTPVAAMEITTGVGNIDGAIWKTIADDEYEAGLVTIPLTGIASGQTSIGLKRSEKQNTWTNGLKVYRAMNPVLTAIQFNETDVEVTSTTIAATLPNGTDLSTMTVTPTIAWNGAGTAVAANTWEWGVANTYTVTDKDGDATVYTITLNKAAAIDRVEISGTPSVMVDATTTLSAAVYDTNDALAPLQDVTWSVKSGDEDYASVSTTGVVTGKAIGSAHIIATSVADPTIWAQVEVAVSAFSGCKKVYWFGNAADAATNGVENNSTVFVGAPSSASNNSSKTIKLIADEWEVSVSKKTGSIGSFGTFKVPAGYSATLYVVTNTGGSRTFQLKQADDVKYTQSATSGDPVVTVFENVLPGDYTVLSTSNCSGFYMMAAELCRVPMTGVALDVASKSMLTIDAPFQLTPAFVPANASDKRVIWSTDNAEAATVVDGLVTPVGVGTANITVRTEDGNFTDVCAVTVSAIDCASFEGVLYQMTAKEQASRKDISVSGGESNEVALTTADVVYTRGVAASLGVKGSNTKTPRITAKSGETLSSVDYNSADVYVKIPLGCALRATDVITFTANDDTKELKLGNTATSEGTINTTNLAYTVQSGDALEGKDVIYVWRGDNSGFVSVTITRVPLVEVTAVSLADLTILTTMSGTPTLTVEPSNAAILSAAWEITAPATPASTINATSGLITAGSEEETLTVKVTVNGDKTATCTVNVISGYSQVDVTGSTVWDWQYAASGETTIKVSSSTAPIKKDVEGVMANVNVEGKMPTNNATFNSQALLFSGENVRAKDGGRWYASIGHITFNVTVPGLVRVEFSDNGSNNRRLKINDELSESSSGKTDIKTFTVEVPVGSVTLMGVNEDGTGSDRYIRISKIEFLALAHRRTAAYSVGELGTICLEDDAKAVGANVYELQGHDENGKMVFDQILSGEIEAGKPYLFQATNASQVSFYKKVNATHKDDPVSLKGMYGTFVDKPLYPTIDVDMFYFSGTHIWAVKDFTVASITIPAYRCYVNYAEFMENPVGSSTPLPGRKRMLIGVNGAPAVATGVENAAATDKPAKMLINGQLFILRGEKMYDAKGQLVK